MEYFMSRGLRPRDSYREYNGFLDVAYNEQLSNGYLITGAASCGKLEMVKFLIKHGSSHNHSWDYPKRMALENNHMHVVKYLESLY
jgi:hypothetical protein